MALSLVPRLFQSGTIIFTSQERRGDEMAWPVCVECLGRFWRVISGCKAARRGESGRLLEITEVPTSFPWDLDNCKLQDVNAYVLHLMLVWIS